MTQIHYYFRIADLPNENYRENVTINAVIWYYAVILDTLMMINGTQNSKPTKKKFKDIHL